MNTIQEEQLDALRAMQSPLMAKDATLRDLFAGMALPAIYKIGCGDITEAEMASEAYSIADEMLAARKEAR